MNFFDQNQSNPKQRVTVKSSINIPSDPSLSSGYQSGNSSDVNAMICDNKSHAKQDSIQNCRINAVLKDDPCKKCSRTVNCETCVCVKFPLPLNNKEPTDEQLITSLERSVMLLKRKCKLLEEQCQKLKEGITSGNKNAEKLQQRLQDKLETCKKLEDMLCKKDETLMSLKVDKEKIQDCFKVQQEALQCLENNIASKTKEIECFQEAQKQLSKTLKEMCEENKKLSEELHHSQEKVISDREQSEKELFNLEEEKSQLSSKIQELTADKRDLASDLDKAQTQVLHLNIEQEKSRNKLAEAEKVRLSLEKSQSELSTQFQGLSNNIVEIKGENKTLKDHLHKTEQERDQIGEKNYELRKIIDEQEEKLVKTNEEKGNILETLKSAKKHNESLGYQLDTQNELLREKDNLIDKMLAEKDKLIQELSEREASAKQLDERVNGLRQNLWKLTTTAMSSNYHASPDGTEQTISFDMTLTEDPLDENQVIARKNKQ